MKKALLGTTSLLTASLFAASAAHAEGGIKLGLGGYMNNFFAVGDDDPDDGTDYAPTGLFSDGEVWFSGETTLDNGLSFGANIQLESFGDTGDTIDEDFGYMEGGFGRFQFGSENTAAYLMHFAAPSVGAPVNTGWVTSFIAQPAGHTAGFRSPGLSTYIDPGNDENVLTYFTPRMFGFQIGLSYQPAVVFSANGKNFPVFANEDTEYNNGIAVGINFVETFGAVDLSVSGGYRRAEAPDNNIVALVSQTGAGGTVRTFSPDDIEMLSFGANIGFAGFTLGGSYANELEGRLTSTSSALGTAIIAPIATGLVAPFSTVTNTTSTVITDVVSTEGQSWDVGLSYSTGPWTFGALYFHGEVEGSLTTPGENELDAAQAAIAYAVGPGITASLTGMYADWDTEGNNQDNDGIAGIVGINFGF